MGKELGKEGKREWKNCNLNSKTRVRTGQREGSWEGFKKGVPFFSRLLGEGFDTRTGWNKAATRDAASLLQLQGSKLIGQRHQLRQGHKGCGTTPVALCSVSAEPARLLGAGTADLQNWRWDVGVCRAHSVTQAAVIH